MVIERGNQEWVDTFINMEHEAWKDIPWYEELYQASTEWNVRSINFNKTWMIKNVSLMKQNTGYYQVWLSKKWIVKRYSVHRVILITFVWQSSLEVNHIDWIKTNNRLLNLEYCTKSENMKHAYRTWLSKKPKNKIMIWTDNPMTRWILQIDSNWNVIKEYISAVEASNELWVLRSWISNCCTWKRKTTGWYRFQFKVV